MRGCADFSECYPNLEKLKNVLIGKKINGAKAYLEKRSFILETFGDLWWGTAIKIEMPIFEN